MPKQTKHPGGRPLKFKTKKELEEKIEEYFTYCANRFRTTIDKEGNEHSYIWPEPYTISGLAVWLDTSRQTLINYEERDEFFDTIARAKQKIEHDLEVRTIESRTPNGGIFVLKNGFGWRDETHSHIEGSLKTSNELTPEAAAVLAKASRAKDGTTKSE